VVLSEFHVNVSRFWMGKANDRVQNSISRDAFEFMWRHIHFCNNSRAVPETHQKYDPLFKIREVISAFSVQLRKSYTAGGRVTIDESMIKYMGRAASFVMYTPLKPIKHGIKVFCLCCSYSAMLLSFVIYVGKDYVEEKSTKEVVDKLILLSNLQTAKGRILYTDNYYTSFA